MDVVLSDLLTCPRCGPRYGLILLPEEVRERRVVAGVLGCANCRERYVVEGGVADLRARGSAGSTARGAGWGGAGVDAESVVRLAALLGLTGPGGTVLLAGPVAAEADGLAELVEGVSVVAAAERVLGVAAGEVSWLRVDARLPLRGGSLRGVALTGSWAERVEEGARLLGPTGRLVVEPAPGGARARAEAVGLRVLLEEGEVLVAGRRE